jgi:hypothetical protein
MENEIIKHLIQTNETLIGSNHRLTVVTENSIEKRDALSTVCMQIYQSLPKKKERSKKEEKWRKALKEVLHGRV